MAKRTKNHTHILRKFESVSEFHNYLCNNEVSKTFKGFENSDLQSKSYTDWTKTESYAQADGLLLYGDKELQKKIMNAGVKKTRLKLNMKATRRQIFSAVCGVAPNVPNAIAGVPTNMIAVKNVAIKQKVVNVCYFITANGDTEADDLLQASANVISACMEIEASGVRVNLYVGFLSEKLDDTVGFIMRIKSASQPFDVLKMAYPMAHPSMLRRHFFKAMEVTENVPTQFAPTYGHALSNAKEIRRYTESITKNMQAVYSYYDAKGKTIEEIKEMIVRGNK